jgi:hypothetical protein
MILVVLLVIIVSMGLLIFAAWHGLCLIDRVAARAGITKAIPVFGVLSLAAPLVGFVGVVVGLSMDSGGGVALALAALFAGPLLGVGLGVVSLIARERPFALPVLGISGSLIFAVFFLLR